MKCTNFHTLPPLKRYKLIQEQELSNKPSSTNPLTSLNNSSSPPPPLCLPAKKRKHYSPPDSTNCCLPAKKRIMAFNPFDLNHLPILSPIKKSQEPIEKNNENDEDGIFCVVCNSTDGDPSDPIVLCDGCDIMVHALCYGDPFTKGIPKGDWFCDVCLDLSSTNVEHVCCLCTYKGGALKKTMDGKWVHLVCAIYVPEVFFSDPDQRKGIDCSKVLKKRWENKCYVCESKNGGCVIDCSEPKCPLAFHVTCGLKEELCIEYREGKKDKSGVVVAFCSKHTDLWKKQEQTGKFKIVARDE